MVLSAQKKIVHITYPVLLSLFFLSFFISSSSHAQIQPPDFVCVRNDTLIWNIPNNSCGGFNRYLVFASRSEQGPYEILTEITNPNQTSFVHPTPSSQTWFYYLESDFNCPGQNRLQSDTLTNQLPAVAPIQFVTVEGNDVRIQWEYSPSPQVTAYIIYKMMASGTVPIDTVFSGNSYVDTHASPHRQPESYFVLGRDVCGNTSLFDEPHHTILLQAEVSSCDQWIVLHWNLYENWPEGIGFHQVWRVDAQGNETLLSDTIPATTTQFTVRDINDGEEYCLYIKTIRNGTPIFSNSNRVCIQAEIVQPNREFVLLGASATADNSIELKWQWSANAELQSYQILRSTKAGEFIPILSATPARPLSRENTFVDADIQASEGPFYYQIKTIDECQDTVASNYASTIRLHGLAGNRINTLNWTPLDMETAFVQTYDLYRISNSGEELLNSLPTTVLTLEDLLVSLSPEEAAGLCYVVEAKVLLPLPAGGFERLGIRSNIFCLEQPVRIVMPNAFAPNGQNPEFKPVIQFGEAATYQMLIYDRYGKLLFQSTSPESGWKGRDEDGNLAPMGMYVYYVTMTQANGKRTEAKGTVLLLR